MEQYIKKSAVVAEIDKRLHQLTDAAFDSMIGRNLIEIKDFLDTLEVKESELPNPRFPHLNNIVDKVFGAGNLESFEYEEAKQLVLLAKEELLKDLEVKEVDLNEFARHYLLHEHISPLNEVLHQADLKVEMQYHKDIENAYKAGFELGLKTKEGE